MYVITQTGNDRDERLHAKYVFNDSLYVWELNIFIRIIYNC